MNAIVGALGGAHLTETEFVSMVEQHHRSGVDKLAVEAMYKVYDIVPDKHIDSFINNVLLLYSVDDAKNTNSLRDYINNIIDAPDNESLYDDRYVHNLFPTLYSVTDGKVRYFNSADEKPDMIGYGTGKNVDTISIGEYLGATKSSEISDSISKGGLKRPIINISPSASLRSVMDFVHNSIFTLDLIEEDKRDEFINEAKKFINGGTSNIDYSILFSQIGIKKLEYIVHSTNYIAAGRLIYNNGEPVGAFEINKDGEFEMDDSVIVPFVNAISVGHVVINSKNNDVVKELNDLGYTAHIIDNRMYVLTNRNILTMSTSERDAVLSKFQSTIKSEAKKFFGNMKSSHRIISPSLSMLLDATSMTLPELINWMGKAVVDSGNYINSEINKLLPRLIYNNIDTNAFVSMHVIKDELLPFIEKLLDSLSESDLSGEFSDSINSVYRAYSEMTTNVYTFTKNYNKAFNKFLANRYGFDEALFDPKYEEGDLDIKSWMYYIKYPEKSSNYYVRKAVSVLKDMMSDRAQMINSYDKIEKLLSKLKKHGISDFDFIYEKGRNNKTIKGIRKSMSATGYAMDKIHWGDFRDEMDKFSKFLAGNKNLDGSTKEWSADGLYDRSVPSKYWKEYRTMVNDWLKLNTVLPMDESYIDAINSLSKETYIKYTDSRSHLTTLFSSLSAEDIADNTGEYQQFVDAYKSYMFMFSPYNPDGKLKETDTSEYTAYVELKNFKNTFNPDSVDASSSKFDELKDLINEKASNRRINQSQAGRLLQIFSGSNVDAEKKTKSVTTDLSDLIKASNAGGMDLSAFNDSDMYYREFMMSMYDPDEASKYELSSEYFDLKRYYENKYPAKPGANGLITRPYLTELEKIGAIKVLGESIIYNPLFYIPKKTNHNIDKPASVFAFDPTTFTGVSGNEMFDNESLYSMQPNPNIYSNDKFDKLSDLQREIIDDVKDILADINANNGTISMYGPLLPQRSTGLFGKGVRRFQSTWNPVSAILWPFKVRWTYNNESLSNIIGFKKANNTPSSLFSKNTQMLDDPNTISRDILQLLSISYNDSVTNKVSTKRLFAIKNIIDEAAGHDGKNNPEAAGLINQLTNKFLGIEDLNNPKHTKGSVNWGQVIADALTIVRGVTLAYKWVPITANIAGAVINTANDSTFVDRKDLLDSLKYTMKSALSFSINKFTMLDKNNTDSKLVKWASDDPKMIKMMRLSGITVDNNDRFETYYGKKMATFVTKHLLFGPYTLSDVLSIHPIAHSVFKSIKYYNGKFYGKYQFIDAFAKRDQNGIIKADERKNALKKYNNITENLYDAYDFDENGKHTLREKYRGSNADKMLEYARTVIRNKHRSIAGNKTESLSPSIDNIISPQLFLYRGWQVNALNNLFVNISKGPRRGLKYYSPEMAQYIESQYKSFGLLCRNMLSYLPIIGSFIQEYTDYENKPVNARDISQYQIDNGKLLLRNLLAAIIAATGGAILTAMALEGIGDWLAPNNPNYPVDPNDKRFKVPGKKKRVNGRLVPYYYDVELEMKYKLYKAAGVMMFRMGNELSAQYNPTELLNLPTGGNPLSSIFNSGYKYLSNIASVDMKDPILIQANRTMMATTGMSIAEINEFGLAKAWIPGVMGASQINDIFNSPQGTKVKTKLPFNVDQLLIDLVGDRFAPRYTGFIRNMEKMSKDSTNMQMNIDESIDIERDEDQQGSDEYNESGLFNNQQSLYGR